MANVLPVNRPGRLQSVLGLELHLGWRSYTWRGTTYVFRVAAYLAYENKILQDEGGDGMGHSPVMDASKKETSSDPGRPNPRGRWFVFPDARIVAI